MFYLSFYFVVLSIGMIFLSDKQKLNAEDCNYQNATVKNGTCLYLLLCWLLFSTIAALRGDSVGIDTQSYLAIYERFANGLSIKEVQSFATTIEFGYLVFCKCIISVFKTRFFFFFCNAGIIYGCYLYYIKNNSNDLLISTLMFISLYYTSTFNVMRQYLAIGILLIAIESLKKKKYWITAILIIMAVMIHHSSIMLAPSILLYLLPHKSKNIIKIEAAIIGLFLIIRIPSVFNWLIRLLKYDRLLNGVHFKAADSSGMMAIVYLAIVIMGIIISIKERLKKNEENEMFAFHLINSSIGTGFALLAGNNEMFARAGAGYISFIVILFPVIVAKLCKDAKNLFLARLIIVIFLCFALYVNARGYHYYSYI